MYWYNFLARPVQIIDDAGVKNLVYNSFNELEIREGCKTSYKGYPCLWLITWDPTQPIATRPLAIQKDGTWYTYGWDLTKNIYEIFGQNGYIRSTYAYTPFGSVTASGDVTQPIQWSSEYYDNELALVYYNYRHYNPTDGRWINRDPIAEQGGWNLYSYCKNHLLFDILGREPQLPALFDDYIGATSELKKEVNTIIKKDLYYRAVDLIKKTMIRIATVEYGGAVLRKGKKNKFKYLIVSDKGRSLSYNRTKYVNDTVKFFEFQGYCEIAIWHSHPIIFRAERGYERLLFNARFEGDCTLGALTAEDLEIANGVDILGNKNGKKGYLNIVEGKPSIHKENPKNVPAYMVHRKQNPAVRYLITLEKFHEYGLPFSEMDYGVVLSMHNIWSKNNPMAVITFSEGLDYAILRAHPSMDSGNKVNTPKTRLERLLEK